MAREQLFSETKTFSTSEPTTPDTQFFLESMALAGEAVRGESVDLDLQVNVAEAMDRNYYLTTYVDGEEVDDQGDLFFNPTDGGWNVVITIPVPDATSFDVTVEGGYDG